MNNYIEITETKRNYAQYCMTVGCVMTLILAMILAIPSQAQDAYPKSSFGIRGGVNLNSWTNEYPYYVYEGQPLYPDSWKATTGFHVGGYVNIRLSQLVALEPALMYSSKGTAMTAESGGIVAQATVVSNYMDLPFLIRLYVADGFNLFLGPQMSYQLNSSYDIDVDGTSLISGEDISNDISELDFAAVLGMGYQFKGGFNINLDGEFGLATVDGYNELSTYNRTIRLSLGYQF